MSFKYYKLFELRLGSEHMIHGTYENTNNSQGGTINTGFSQCRLIIIQPKNKKPEYFECLGNSFTVAMKKNEKGFWSAVGKY